jgi:hypothetical protein
MNAITREELARVVDRAQRGEDLARRRSPQPSILVEYFRERERQMEAVRQHLIEKAEKGKGERQ